MFTEPAARSPARLPNSARTRHSARTRSIPSPIARRGIIPCMVRHRRMLSIVVVPLLVVCDPEPDEGLSEVELQAEQLSACQPEICSGLDDPERAICILEHIQSGAPGYFTVGHCCTAGPVGTRHTLLNGDGTATQLDEFDCYYCEEDPEKWSYGVSDVVIDPERIANYLAACASPEQCTMCGFACALGSEMSKGAICKAM